MRVIIQRVSSASVEIEQKLYSSIGAGMLILVGFEAEDTEQDIEWMVQKITQLRIFKDSEEKMNLNIQDIDGEILVVSQFTLFASTKKGNRPSFIQAAKPEIAIPLYTRFCEILEKQFHKKIGTGIFGADMKIQLTNDGPVTILIDSKNKQ